MEPVNRGLNHISEQPSNNSNVQTPKPSLTGESGDWGRRIIINVSGLRFETFEETLCQFPETLLGSSAKRDFYYDIENNEYFFDRNRSSFEAILFFYQSKGKLVRPSGVPFYVFSEEVKFFELGKEYLQRLEIDEKN